MKIRVIMKRPDKEPYVTNISDTLANMQKTVGGHIEVFNLSPDFANVVTYKMETPEDMQQQPETPENPAPPDGWEAWNEEQKNIDLPDGLAVIEEHAEILRRYYRGELVDKSQFLAEIREKLGSL